MNKNLEILIQQAAQCVTDEKNCEKEQLLVKIEEEVQKTDFWNLVHLRDKFNVPGVNEILETKIDFSVNV